MSTSVKTKEILCNRCGKPLNQFDLNEGFGFEYHVGYGSKHDLEHVKARFCCRCFDKMIDEAIKTFAISPVVGTYSFSGTCIDDVDLEGDANE